MPEVCWTCGADWSAGQHTDGCEECGGGALKRDCPVCGGGCGEVWRRAPLDSHDSGRAHWSGRCGRPRVASDSDVLGGPGVQRTPRLRLVPIERRHLPGLQELWTDPRVMANMGFPRGLDPADLDLESYLAVPGEAAPRGRRPGLHFAVERRDGIFVGEAKLAAPDASGTCEPDVKLLPAWWRRGYGEEIARWLIAESFRRWEACRHVQFTPNEANHAARGLYAKVGCREVGHGHEPPGASPLKGFAGVRYRIVRFTRPTDPGPAPRGGTAPPAP